MFLFSIFLLLKRKKLFFQMTCPICYDEIPYDEIPYDEIPYDEIPYDEIPYDEITITTPCNHTYHKICIDKWLQTSSTCPCCRQVIVIKSLFDYMFGDEDDEDEMFFIYDWL